MWKKLLCSIYQKSHPVHKLLCPLCKVVSKEFGLMKQSVLDTFDFNLNENNPAEFQKEAKW